MPVVRCLSFHATYRCRQTGACCASDWPVPVEADQRPAIEAAIAGGQLTTTGGPAERWLVESPDRPPLLARREGRCVFLRTSPVVCAVHATVGHAALPLACRMFPRVVVVDPRGVSVTLSHFCPTAAGMLSDESPAGIVTAPRAFPPDGEYDGLDASMAMPPLLRPDMMMDWDAWWDFEARAVDALLSAPPAVSLGRLQAIVERLRRWEPARGPLTAAVGAAFEEIAPDDGRAWRPTADDVQARIRDVVAATPTDLATGHAQTLTESTIETAEHGARRFLAAHGFANWPIQLGSGLRTWLSSIEAAHALVASGVGVRTADLWIRHLADTHALVRTWQQREGSA